MPEGGRLDIATGNREYHEPASTSGSELKRGRYVVLSIADTGRGMSPEIVARIFEPFFSTKDSGLGTGLGLATSYGIVRQSGGHIAVQSEPGSGTRFEVYLPAVDANGPAADSSGLPPTGSEPGVEVILLVEDEAMVRRLVRTMLEDHGYTVLEAGTPSAALAIARDHRGPIHLLLTDVVMPELGGRRLAEALRGERADISVLYMSGYTDDAVLRHGVVEEVEAFLQKPFSVVELLQKVRNVLDARTHGAREV
jgi:two-component system cell cycle sensor histidine kinase/response regulator CckA